MVAGDGSPSAGSTGVAWKQLQEHASIFALDEVVICMVTTRPPKTIVKPTALGSVANTDTKLLIYGLFQKGRVLAQDGIEDVVEKTWRITEAGRQAAGEGRERYFGCNLMQRKVLASSHQHLMAEAPATAPKTRGRHSRAAAVSPNGGRTASCWRRATFSRASSRRALKAETRARTSDEIMPAWSRQTGD